MSFGRRLSLALALLGFTLATREAGAQTLNLQLLTGTRGVEWPSDYDHGGLHIQQINQNDCIQDPTIQFNLTLGTAVTGPYQQYVLEAWIGTACDTMLGTARTNGQCVLVGTSSIADHFIDIDVQKLLQPLSGGDVVASTGGTGGTGGTSGTGGTLGSLVTGGTGGTGGTFGFAGSTAALSEFAGFGGTTAFLDASAGGVGATAGDAGVLGGGGMPAAAGTSDLGVSGMAGTAGSGTVSVAGAGGASGAGGTVVLPSTGGTVAFPSAGGSTSVSGSGGDTGTAGSGATNGISIPTVCEGSPDVPTPVARTLFFMLVDPGGNVYGSGGVLKWTFNYDLTGPAAPSSVTAGIGEGVLVVKWTEASEDTDLYQYQLLCDPPPLDKQPSGGILGAAGAGGQDDGAETIPSNTQCYSSAFTPGGQVTNAQIAAYGCGVAQLTSTNAEAKPLENYVHYTVAVVAEDQYHNFGVVSDYSCNTPEPVTDFYEAYRAAGGKGGGGFCSISSQRSHALTALLLAGSFALFARRRANRQGRPRNRA